MCWDQASLSLKSKVEVADRNASSSSETGERLSDLGLSPIITLQLDTREIIQGLRLLL